jgi:hypothetical protein
MPSNSKTKTETPVQVIKEDSPEEHVVITLEIGTPTTPSAKGKEEAGKPLYLKRV